MWVFGNATVAGVATTSPATTSVSPVTTGTSITTGRTDTQSSTTGTSGSLTSGTITTAQQVPTTSQLTSGTITTAQTHLTTGQLSSGGTTTLSSNGVSTTAELESSSYEPEPRTCGATCAGVASGVTTSSAVGIGVVGVCIYFKRRKGKKFVKKSDIELKESNSLPPSTQISIDVEGDGNEPASTEELDTKAKEMSG